MKRGVVNTEERIRQIEKILSAIAFGYFVLLIAFGLLRFFDTPVLADQPEDLGRIPGDDSPALAQCLFLEDQEEAENELIEAALLARATKIEDAIVTHYCICSKCCGKSPDHPAYGITASGKLATPGVSVGVDPDVIPLGADVLVDYGDGEIHYYRADDTGIGISGNHIDLCVGSHQEALELGVRSATVWWVMP